MVVTVEGWKGKVLGISFEINGKVLAVYLPTPIVARRPPLALNAGPIAKFFHRCPNNALFMDKVLWLL
ncbi:hypothetical protein Fmac_011616 [Flemingia macrophylla]|uniref:Uncharacterized protein n=1 Tax=Flemingia macrophylla TaxID=520843 RepID=A0ABD1MMZ4_9FABA